MKLYNKMGEEQQENKGDTRKKILRSVQAVNCLIDKKGGNVIAVLLTV
jgi:hypothetical protein